MDRYLRPIPRTDVARPPDALPLAGGWCWFDTVEELHRDAPARLIPASDLTDTERARLSAPRPPLLGQSWSRPAIMGVLNVTPDSFSDGGLYHEDRAAVARARAMLSEGADILDIGGESTRPGADTIAEAEEIARVRPVVATVASDPTAQISIDTRKSAVAEAALQAGAGLINDISGLSYDPAILDVAARHSAPICLMHSQKDPKVMQQNPRYEDVLLDVYDFLATRIAMAELAGVPRARIIVDPGVGFGKTLEHNLALIRRLSLFHNLGCPILVGLSRKSIIGKLANVSDPRDRMPGSVAAALAAVSSGAQILRVHDVSATRQAVSVMIPLQK